MPCINDRPLAARGGSASVCGTATTNFMETIMAISNKTPAGHGITARWNVAAARIAVQ